MAKSEEVLARLNKEMEDLQEKIAKLKTFILSDNFTITVKSKEERGLMRNQLVTMELYLMLLQARKEL